MTSTRRSAPTRTRRLVVAGVLGGLLLVGCGGDEPPDRSVEPARTSAQAPPAPAASRPTTTTRRTPARPAPPASWTASCPTATPSPAYGCRASRGRVIGLESVDPDGDGDLHLVVREQLPAGGVTLPGITVLDVRASLRPARDPRPGDLVTGAGPVFRGSFRQKQIQVDVLRLRRARG